MQLNTLAGRTYNDMTQVESLLPYSSDQSIGGLAILHMLFSQRFRAGDIYSE